MSETTEPFVFQEREWRGPDGTRFRQFALARAEGENVTKLAWCAETRGWETENWQWFYGVLNLADDDVAARGPVWVGAEIHSFADYFVARYYEWLEKLGDNLPRDTIDERIVLDGDEIRSESFHQPL